MKIGLAIHRSWVQVLVGHHRILALGKLLTPVCQVTKRYNLVPAKGQLLSAAGKVTISHVSLDLQFTGHGFKSRPGTIVYLRLCASVTKQYNLLPAREWLLSAAGKVTVGLSSHWACVTDLVVYPPTSSWPKEGR